ncbi:MAG: chlorite dismutase family protein [Actinomycetota bacterium]|nr:chlorite dismutase family protein [Actinomycetota bacterium]
MIFVPLTVFAGGQAGAWQVLGVEPVTGPSLPPVSRLAVLDGTPGGGLDAAWALRGATSNGRYTRRNEQEALAARQAGLGRPEATRAALIPITKSDAWWALAQDERRDLFEETSHHITIGMQYLPAVARRLYHSRDLSEPFDFLTWFEYALRDAPAFEELVSRLRATPEWNYVKREVDIRLAR